MNHSIRPLRVLLLLLLLVPCTHRDLRAQSTARDSVTALRKTLRSNPKDLASLLALGRLYVSMDSLDRAIVTYSQASELSASDARVWEGLGDVYMKQNVPTMAALQYEKVLALDTLRPDVRYKLARCYIKDQRYGEAGDMYLALLRQDSTNTAAMLDLGKIFFAARQPGNASIWLGRYLAARPDDADIRPLYMESLYASRQFAAARTEAARVLAATPGHVRALRISADVAFGTGDWPYVIEATTRLRAVDTLRVDDLQQLAKARVQTGSDSLAALVYEEALTIEPDNGDLLGDLGSVYMRMRAYDRAAAVFERRFQKDPDAVSAYVNYALSSMAQTKWEAARTALLTVIERKPDYVQGHLFLARCFAQMDSTRQAQREYDAVVALTAGQDEKYRTERAEAFGMIGFAHLIDKRYPQAIESLTTSIKLKDDNAQYRLWRAQAWALSGKRDDAVREYKVVLKLDPKNKDARKGLELLGQ
jgi:tetratricopeptide (TPR) repeat protein